MKTLLILRHAKSSWEASNLDDHERPLSKRGRADAPRMGKLLHKQNLLPDLILCSSAERARTTTELVAEAASYKGETMLSRDLYAAPPQAYLDALSKVPDQFKRVMLVGHNPGLEQLLYLLTGQPETLPTTALAQVDLPIDKWGELSKEAKGTLMNIWRPKEL
jgi:phosphohistidine phosphatase